MECKYIKADTVLPYSSALELSKVIRVCTGKSFSEALMNILESVNP